MHTTDYLHNVYAYYIPVSGYASIKNIKPCISTVTVSEGDDRRNLSKNTASFFLEESK